MHAATWLRRVLAGGGVPGQFEKREKTDATSRKKRGRPKEELTWMQQYTTATLAGSFSRENAVCSSKLLRHALDLSSQACVARVTPAPTFSSPSHKLLATIDMLVMVSGLGTRALAT